MVHLDLHKIVSNVELFPDTKLSQQADISFDNHTLPHCVWELLTDPMRAECENL